MSHERRDVNPLVALVGIVITLTVVQLLYWRGLRPAPPEELGGPREGRGPSSRFEVPAGRSDVRVGTLAGSPASGHQDGPASEALFDGPAAVASDSSGTIYVADSRNHCLRRVSPDGLVSTLAGVAGEAGFADGSRTEARFLGPAGLAVAADGSLVVVDTGNHMIRRVSRAGDVTTLAGAQTVCDDLGRPLGGHRDGPAHVAQFRYPVGVAASDDGAVYVADAGNHCVRRIDRSGEVTTLSTEGEGQLEAPTHLALAEDGRLWVADTAGGALWVGSAFGPLQRWEPPERMADLSSPAGLAFVGGDGSDPRLVVADSGANCLWEIGDGQTAILAGVGSGEPPGWRDGPGDRAQFSCPAGVATGPRAGLLVADFGNNCVRQVLSRADAKEVE